MPILKKYNLPLICQQKLDGVSNRKIAENIGASRNTVNEIIRRMEASSFTLAEIAAMTESKAIQLFDPPHVSRAKSEYYMPDFKRVAQFVFRPGHTVEMAWEKYVRQCNDQGTKPYGITQFRYYLDQHLQTTAYSMVISKKAGERIEVDWAGTSPSWIDPDSRDVVKGNLFVGVLSFSGYAFAYCTPDKKMESWIQSHVKMLEYFQGAAPYLIPDNLKTGVIRNADNRIVVHPTYKDFGRHYGMTIIPSRVYSPKDKPLAENTVDKLTKFIIHKLEEVTLFSIDEYNEKILELLDVFNRRPFQKKNGSRYSMYMDFDKPALRPLPSYPYITAVWKEAKVQKNSFVVYQYNYYSVPVMYVGKKVKLKATGGMIEIFLDGVSIASHKIVPSGKGAYQYERSHFPEYADRYNDWDTVKYLNLSKTIGPNVYAVISRLFQGVEIKQTRYKSADDIIMLGKKYGNDVLDKTCALALSLFQTPTYLNVKGILEKNEVTGPTAADDPAIDEPGTFTRGGDYYGNKEY